MWPKRRGPGVCSERAGQQSSTGCLHLHPDWFEAFLPRIPVWGSSGIFPTRDSFSFQNGSIYWARGTMLTGLYLLSDSVLPATLWGRFCPCSHFADEATDNVTVCTGPYRERNRARKLFWWPRSSSLTTNIFWLLCAILSLSLCSFVALYLYPTAQTPHALWKGSIDDPDRPPHKPPKQIWDGFSFWCLPFFSPPMCRISWSLYLSSILAHQIPLGLGPSLTDFLHPVPGTLPGI